MAEFDMKPREWFSHVSSVMNLISADNYGAAQIIIDQALEPNVSDVAIQMFPGGAQGEERGVVGGAYISAKRMTALQWRESALLSWEALQEIVTDAELVLD